MKCCRWFTAFVVVWSLWSPPGLRAEYSSWFDGLFGKSQETLLQEANDGEAEAQILLGHRALGEGKAKEAARWFRKAATGGDSEAQTALAKLLLEGKPGVAKNRQQALAWLEKAGRNGSPEAAERLYRWFSEGKEVPRNPGKAFVWLSTWRQATIDDPKPDFLLATCYLHGEGIDRDLNKARNHFQEAVNAGYSLPPGEIDRLIGNVVTGLTALADAGDPTSQWRRGYMHENGEILEKSPPLAAQWYRRAAEQGDTEAMFCLANLLSETPTLASGEETREGWLEKAAQGGHARASHLLRAGLNSGQEAFPYGSPVLLADFCGDSLFVCLKSLPDYPALEEKWKENPDAPENEQFLPEGFRTGGKVVLIGEFGERIASFTSFRYLYDYGTIAGILDVPRGSLKTELPCFCLNPDPRTGDGNRHRRSGGKRSMKEAALALTGQKITRSFVDHVRQGILRTAPRAEAQAFAAVGLSRDHLRVYRPRLSSPNRYLVAVKAAAGPGLGDEDINTQYLSALALTDAAGNVLGFMDLPCISLSYNTTLCFQDIDADGVDEIIHNSQYYEGEYWYFSRWLKGAFHAIEIGGSGL